MSYDNETYLKSLSKARGEIGRQVQNAFNEIGRQRDVSIGKADGLGAAAGKVTAHQSKRTNQGISQGGGALSALGLGRLGGVTNALHGARTEVHGSMNNITQAYHKAGGLLRKGFAEQADQRFGQADGIAKQLYSDNDGKRMEYINQRQQEDRERAFQTEMAERQRAAQQAAMAQQASLAQQQMAHSSSLANQGRDFQQQQALQGYLHEAIKNRDFSSGPQGVQQLYAAGHAPPGMSLSDFGRYLGVQMPAPGYGTTFGGRIGGHTR